MPKPITETKSFTTTSNGGLLRQLINEVHVYPATNTILKTTRDNEFKALWDTGATNTTISQSVTDRCRLAPIGFSQLITASETVKEAPNYLVDIYLPNKVKIESVKVIQGNLLGFDLLIGMDIMSLGDFAVTNIGGFTTFSFRIPSIERIDFTRPPQHIRAMPKVGRNNPCFCGSGVKFKDCHGKTINKKRS